VTKQIGKTLTSIGESPDQRGLQKVNKAQNPQFSARKVKKAHEMKNDDRAGPIADSGKCEYL
jgi:hypothetical protein